MFGSGVKLEGVDALMNAFGSRFRISLKKKVLKANLKMAAKFNVQLTKTIEKTSLYHENDAVTSILKGSSTPLKNTGKFPTETELKFIDNGWGFDVIAHKYDKNGNDIAAFLHWGGHVTVTDGHRKFFYAMFKATGGRIKPLKDSTTTLFIPARPYMLHAYKRGTGTRKTMRKFYTAAISKAFKEASGKPGRWFGNGPDRSLTI